ncbi:class I SAM-dependent methyltransferase [Streptomyces sp. NPDC050315]|uniref:class I SAM-dependent methyltransferase n=1 Tax=Streptomyces sp. NPDC050315 TaxID=3155039 RepID=UPI00344806F4
MATAAEHYDRLLAEHYTWMLGGDIPASASGQAELLRDLGIGPQSDRDVAIDLGCGSGAQTLALADLGFSPVIAVDSSARLLDELAGYAKAAPAVRTVHGDLCDVLPAVAEPGTAAAIVCMGDTLLHLPSKEEVSALLHDAARALRPGGHLVLTYRDLTQELQGTDRFLPVRATDDRLLTCFLEYRDEDTVLVHDLLHTRSGGEWQLRASSYPKLRLSPTWLADRCVAAGLQIRYDAIGARGMQVLHAVRP